MDCPRCGGSLTHYQLADAETVACDDCVYVGVPVDHTSTRERPESWSDALERFYRAHSTEQAPASDPILPVFEPAETADDATAESTTAEPQN